MASKRAVRRRLPEGTVQLHKLPTESRELVAVEEAGSLEALLIDDLKLDPLYQRDLSTDLVQQMAEAWDLAVAGAIVVSRRGNGDLFIVDGQHRVAAAKMAGETHILAQVLTGLGQVTEADMRLKGNVRRGDSAMERFKAQLAAHNKESQSIVEICANFNTQINLDSPTYEHGINAVSALESVYRRDGTGILLGRVFDVIKKAWGEVGGPNATAMTIRGLAWMITAHGDEIDKGRLADRLQSVGSTAMARKAEATRAAMGGSRWLNWYRAAIEVYNERLPNDSRLEWRTRGWSRGKGSKSSMGGSSWTD